MGLVLVFFSSVFAAFLITVFFLESRFFFHVKKSFEGNIRMNMVTILLWFVVLSVHFGFTVQMTSLQVMVSFLSLLS